MCYPGQRKRLCSKNPIETRQKPVRVGMEPKRDNACRVRAVTPDPGIRLFISHRLSSTSPTPWWWSRPTRWWRQGQQQQRQTPSWRAGSRPSRQRWQRGRQRGRPPSRRHQWRSRSRRRQPPPRRQQPSPPRPSPRPRPRGRGLQIVSFERRRASRTGAGQHTEVQIGHDVPGGLAVVDGAAEAEDLTGEHPPDETNRVATLVVGGDGNVDILGGRVGVAESDHGDVDVRSLLDGLGIGAGVGDDDEAGLLERAGDVVGERAGGEAAGDGLGAGVGSELEHGALAVGTGRDDANIARVVNGGDDAGGEADLLPVRNAGLAACVSRLRRTRLASSRVDADVPGLANVDDVHTIGTGLPEVRCTRDPVRCLSFGRALDRGYLRCMCTPRLSSSGQQGPDGDNGQFLGGRGGAGQRTSWSRHGTEQRAAAQCRWWWR